MQEERGPLAQPLLRLVGCDAGVVAGDAGLEVDRDVGVGAVRHRLRAAQPHLLLHGGGRDHGGGRPLARRGYST